jgi:hypothetical protein
MKHLERTDHTEQEDNRVKIRVFKNWKDLGENQESTQVRGGDRVVKQFGIYLSNSNFNRINL